MGVGEAGEEGIVGPELGGDARVLCLELSKDGACTGLEVGEEDVVGSEAVDGFFGDGEGGRGSGGGGGGGGDECSNQGQPGENPATQREQRVGGGVDACRLLKEGAERDDVF